MSQNMACGTDTGIQCENTGQARSFVINRKRWNGIVSHLHRKEIEIELQEQEQKYNEYLIKGSRAMTEKWDNSVHAIQTKKAEERWKREQDALVDAEKKYKELVKNDEKSRDEKLKLAQDMMHRLKTGPRQLERATILSEVLKTREIQRTINDEQRKKAREDKLQDGRETIEEAQKWTEEHKKKILAAKKRVGDYKAELYANTKKEAQMKLEKAKEQAEAERALREAEEKEFKEQAERDRKKLEHKKEVLLKIAQEELKMTEQRRKRDLEVDRVEDKLIELYTKEKNCLEKMRKAKTKEKREQALKQKLELAANSFIDYSEQTPEEKERLEKDAERLQAKLREKEQERFEKQKKIKEAIIESRKKEVEQMNAIKARKMENARWEIANRLKTVEVNRSYDEECKKYKTKQLSSNRKILMEQMEEDAKKRKEEKTLHDLEFIRLENERDDKHFFAYADELLADAKKKGRPTLPIQKVIDAYKAQTGLCEAKGDASHLTSTLPMNQKSKDGIATANCPKS